MFVNWMDFSCNWNTRQIVLSNVSSQNYFSNFSQFPYFCYFLIDCVNFFRIYYIQDLAGFDMKNKLAFSQASNWGMKSDILRYEILMKYGGVYVDTDYECLINIGMSKNTKCLNSHTCFIFFIFLFFYFFVSGFWLISKILKYIKTINLDAIS